LKQNFELDNGVEKMKYLDAVDSQDPLISKMETIKESRKYHNEVVFEMENIKESRSYYLRC
jgi:hypothetical protein